jgi:hypothetical protein
LKANFIPFVKRSTARDFRIQVNQIRVESDHDTDDEDMPIVEEESDELELDTESNKRLRVD